MEYYQAIQNRAGQTVAVLNQYLPTLKAGTVDAAGLLALADTLSPLAQTRDHALTNSDAVVNAENQGFLAIQRLTLALPQSAEGKLDDTVPAESDLLDLLAPAYGSGATSTLEWKVEGVDAEFRHTAPVDPSGNTLGPFPIGQAVKLRTRVTNSNGTTTGSVRTLTILNPAP